MKVVIVGAGFGGLKTAVELARRGLSDITLVSSEDYFLHHATMYSTATGRDPRESVFPLSEVLDRYPSIKFIKDYIGEIDATKRTIKGRKAIYKYDNLVMSLGLINQLSSANGQKKYSYGVTSLESTKNFSEAFHDMVIADNSRPPHCAIVGGGMVGVELAGALSDYVKRLKSAHQLTNGNVQVSLIESSKRILPYASKTAGTKIAKQLDRVGVQVITDCKVDRIAKSNMVLNGKSTPVDMAVWTLGGQNNPLFKNYTDVFKLSKRGKVIVNQYMLAYPKIYVIGDNAETKFSGSAVSAIRDAIFVAKNIQRESLGRPKISKRNTNPPLLSIPITRLWAYVEAGGIYAAGLTGAVVRRVVELNYYCHFLPLPKAYSLWRKYRTSNDYCELCKTYSRKPTK